MKRAVSPEISSRTIFPGLGDMTQLSRGGIYENQETSYDNAEEKLLQTNYEVKKLIKEVKPSFDTFITDDY